MLRQMVIRPAAAAAIPEPSPDAVARDAAYATLMSARCALARFIVGAGHREPPRHRAA